MAQLDVTLMRAVVRQRFDYVPLSKGVRRDSYYTFFDAMVAALQQAFAQWQSRATITLVIINGPLATGGMLLGPRLEGPIRGFAPSGGWDPYVRAIAAGVSNQFLRCTAMATLPGVSLYSSFAFVTAPLVPPTANTPCPLMSMVLPGLRMLDADQIRDEIIRNYSAPKPQLADEVADTIAQALNKALYPWLGSTRITRMMGAGPVPTFAPPYVPGGPVVGGLAVMFAGGLD